jgi:pimeloyl-ACP methyl ester carboxylesterase
MGYPKRARVADDIVVEFLPPAKPSSKVIIYCSGAPGMPSGQKTMEYLSKKGYWSFFPRYRGTWESGGEWLVDSPYDDIVDVIEAIGTPMKSEWDGEIYKVDSPEIYVIGGSFGGPAAIFASAHPEVVKAIALSPVVDWRLEQESEAEPMDWLGVATKSAFGEGYRFTEKNWARLSNGEFYNPVDAKENIDAGKLLIVHSKDDDVVLYPPVETFASDMGCPLISLNRAGHLGSSALSTRFLGRKLFKFLRT